MIYLPHNLMPALGNCRLANVEFHTFGRYRSGVLNHVSGASFIYAALLFRRVWLEQNWCRNYIVQLNFWEMNSVEMKFSLAYCLPSNNPIYIGQIFTCWLFLLFKNNWNKLKFTGSTVLLSTNFYWDLPPRLNATPTGTRRQQFHLSWNEWIEINDLN